MLPINFECFVASAACLITVPRAADGAVNYEALDQRRPLCICAFVLMKITMCFSGCPEPHVSRIYRVCLYTRQYGMKTHVEVDLFTAFSTKPHILHSPLLYIVKPLLYRNSMVQVYDHGYNKIRCNTTHPFQKLLSVLLLQFEE